MSRSVPRLAGFALPVVAALSFAASASAAPIVGPAGDAFYTPPASVPASGTPGELIQYRGANVQLGAGAPSINAFTVMYRSTDSFGEPNFVTGTVYVPRATASNRPVLAYAHGTQGLAAKCAPSRQAVAGTEYESPNIIAGLNKGYAVVATDYAGYTNGSSPGYLAGASEGHAVLDGIKAAKQLAGTGVSSASKSAIWGYSQGGQAAGWAGEQASTYAPGINLTGIAAGGVPGDLITSAKYLNKSAGASFLLQGVIGLSEEYPDGIPFNALSNDAGKAAAADAKSNLCLFAALNKYINKDLADLTAGNQTLDQLLQIPSVQQTLAAQALGTKKVDVPVYQYHGQADEFLPLGQGYQLKKDWCAKGTQDVFALYPSEHLTTLFQAATNALTFLGDRIASKPVTGACTSLPDPVSTAAPSGGDFKVNLDKWNLTGTATLKTLNQSLTLPPGSLFDGSANLTKKSLTGMTSIPPFFTTIDILGIKVKTALNLLPTGPVAGSVSLDDNIHCDGRSQ